MRELPLDEEMALDEELNSDEGQNITHRCSPLKSGLDRTGATMVVKNITWPHEVVYCSAEKTAAYQELLVPTFVQGYLVVLCARDTNNRVLWPTT